MTKEDVLVDIYKRYIPEIDATDEQVKYLLKEYKDEKSVIAVHNTSLGYENVFDIGLRNSTYANQTYNGEKTQELSNTIMYTNSLAALLAYPNGDGKYRGETAIILKIPQSVFEHKQGIFEVLKDGTYGIPPQFIKAAFYDGKVIENTISYDKKYNSREADLCEDTIKVEDKKLQVKIFKKLYYKRNNWIEKIRNLFKNKTKYLPEPKQENIKEDFFSKIRKDIPTLEKQADFAKRYKKENIDKEQIDTSKNSFDKCMHL